MWLYVVRGRYLPVRSLAWSAVDTAGRKPRSRRKPGLIRALLCLSGLPALPVCPLATMRCFC